MLIERRQNIIKRWEERKQSRISKAKKAAYLYIPSRISKAKKAAYLYIPSLKGPYLPDSYLPDLDYCITKDGQTTITGFNLPDDYRYLFARTINSPRHYGIF